ncbi:porin family protein [Bacteroides heparinolyticus]|uniref:porin family protein n=1 Tax=Prevotella heparinolytica TaxID=28113 RepID=UPI00359F9365
MKKIITMTLLAGAMLFSAPAKAQVQFGLKAGLNVTNFSLDETVFEKSNQAGYFVGPTVKFTLPIVGLGVDGSLLYDHRSAKLTPTANAPAAVKGDAELKQDQIVVPINLRYGIGLGSSASVFFFAGPQFGFNIGSKENKVFDDIYDWRLKESNLSINLGAGLMLAGHLQLSANYNVACGKTGEFEVLNEVIDTTFKKKNGRASAWQLSLAYYF